MKIYKFKDNVDGHFAFILAENSEQAKEHLSAITSLPFKLFDYKELSEIPKPLVIRNDILPF